MIQFVFSLALVLLVIASVQDLRTREVPTWIVLALLMLALISAASGIVSPWWLMCTGAMAGFAVGWALFQFASLGGGDAQLIIGVGSLLGPLGLILFLFWMALAGGLLACLAALRGQRDYAYCPAIAAGFLGYWIYPGGLLHHFQPAATVAIL